MVHCAIHGPNPIVTGSPNSFGGPPVARHGDLTACGARIVVSGSRTLVVNGVSVARVGDLIDHGGMVVTGDDTIEVGDQVYPPPPPPPSLHNRDWAAVADKNFRTLPQDPIDPRRLTPEQKEAIDLLTRQGRTDKEINEVMNSGIHYEVMDVRRGDELDAFTSAGYSKGATNAYWMGKAVFQALKAEFCKDGVWDR